MSLIEYAMGKNLANVYARCKKIETKANKKAIVILFDIMACTLKYKSGISDYFNYKFYSFDWFICRTF